MKVLEACTPSNPVALAANCAKLSLTLYNLYSERGDKLRAFGSYMQNVGIALEGMGERLTGNAVPILQQLQSVLERATAKLEKYSKRTKAQVACYAYTEASHIKKLTDQTASLVSLLQLALTGQNNRHAMQAELHAQRDSLRAEGAAPEVLAHMATLEGAVGAITAAETPADVHAALQHVEDSQMALSERSMEQVAIVHRSMQHALSAGFGDLSHKMMNVQSSQQELVGSLAELHEELKHEMAGLRQEISRQTGIVGDKLQGIEDGLAFVLDELQQREPQRDCSTAALGMKTAAELLMEALRSGKIQCTGCPVEGLPYAAAGALRPVKLEHCGCTMSAHAADKCAAAQRCLLCRRKIPTGKAGYQADKQIVRVAEAESCGIRVPRLDPERITRGARIGRGGEGIVYRATLQGVGEVALKCLPLAGTSEQDHAQVTTMLTSTYLASMATPLVCRLHGVVWQPDEVWIVMELCEGTAVDAVMRARNSDASLEGLPAPDVLVLAMEVSEALSALHERARTLHLDLKPENVLITSDYKVRLSDFGVSRRLPTRITAKTMTGVSAGTPGYASPEQMLHRRGTARSDVYSLGASMIFFCTGLHPYEGSADMSYIAAQLATGEPMPVPEDLQPERLRSLVQRMVRIDEGSRPTLHQVRKELHRIHCKLERQGARPRFVQPYWGSMATTEPPPPVHAAEEAPAAPRTPAVAELASNSGAPAHAMYTEPQQRPAPEDPPEGEAAPFNTAPAASPFSADAAYVPPGDPPAAASAAEKHSAAPPAPPGVPAAAPWPPHAGVPPPQAVPAAGAFPLQAMPSTGAPTPQAGPGAGSPPPQPVPGAPSPQGAPGAGPPQPAPPAGGPPPPAPYPPPIVDPARYMHGSAFATAPTGTTPVFATAPSSSFGGSGPVAAHGSGPGPNFASGKSGGPPMAQGQSAQHQYQQRQSQSMPHYQAAPQNGAPHFQTAPANGMHPAQTPVGAAMPHTAIPGYYAPPPLQLPGLTLPQLFDAVNQYLLGQQVDLGNATYSMPMLSKVRSLLDKTNNPISRLPDMNPHLRAQPVNMVARMVHTVWALDVAPVGMRALTLWGGKTTVSRGALAVPEKVFLVFGPECNEVIFRDVSFKGGRVLCHGQTCSVRFENCRFSRCAAVAIGGAAVSFVNCLMKHTDVGIYVNGPGTSLTVRKLEAVDCKQVVLIDGSAVGDIDSLQAKTHCITGVEVRGLGSRLTLARSTVAEAVAAAPGALGRDPRLGLPQGWVVRAVHVHQGAAVTASECTLAASYTGFSAADPGTTATLDRSFCCDNERSGIAAAAGAAVTVKQSSCNAAAAAQSIGVEAGDAGTTLELEACSVQGNVSCGVMAYSGAAVKMKGCVSQRNGTAGCFAQDQGTIAMSGGCRSELQTGHSVQSGGSVTATPDCVFVQPPVQPQPQAWQQQAAYGQPVGQPDAQAGGQPGAQHAAQPGQWQGGAPQQQAQYSQEHYYPAQYNQAQHPQAQYTPQ